jgi:hypothetical protein
MAVIRFQDRTPEVYCNESRDFQLLCRAFDLIENGIKYDIDTMLRILSSDYCSNALINLLQTKLGFFTSRDYDDFELRTVLSAFPYIVKYKGSKKSIEQAVNIFLRVNRIKTNYKVDIINKNDDKSRINDDYFIDIGIESELKDVSLLKDILKYVMPTGYNLHIYFYVSPKNTGTLYNYNGSAKALVATDAVSSTVKDNNAIATVTGVDVRTDANEYVVENGNIILPIGENI